MTGLLALLATPDEAAAARAAGADAMALETGAVWRMLPPRAEERSLLAVAMGAGERSSGALDVPAMARFIAGCRQRGQASVLTGRIEAPDLPRLAALAPDYIGLPVNQIAMARHVLAEDRGAGQGAGCDRIFIHDYVLPVSAGAYAFERTKPQRVRFAVTAEVPRNPSARGMADVFSYDIILDAIAAVIAQGHFDLLETLAEAIATRLLNHPAPRRVTLKLEKLDAGPAVLGIEIVREKAITS